MADHSIGDGKGCMKVGLVGPQCFVLFWQYFPGKVLLRRRSVCFIRYAFEFLCSWMQPEGMEFVQRSHPRENSWSMQFVETKKVRSRSPRKLKFVRCIFRLEDLTKSVKWEVMWCLVVFRHDCMASFFSPRLKWAPLEIHPLCPKKKLFTSACTTQTESHEANITAEITKPMSISYPCR